MNDDTLKLDLQLSPFAARYVELYPSVPARLAAILASRDPSIRQRAQSLWALVRMRDSQRLERLRGRWGLTKTEARLALHLIDGGDIAGYARAYKVSPGTARSQLKSIFAKTGVTRQAALVRLGQREA